MATRNDDGSCSQILDMYARNDVFTTCVEFCANWKKIGLTLGISTRSLDAIAESNMESESGCMRDMLDLWLSSSNEEQEQLRPTWRDLCLAIASVDKKAALRIVREHPCQCSYCKGKQLFSTKILQERVLCNLVLSVIAGLPDCEKSYLMHKLMDEVLISPTNVKDTSSPHSPFFCHVPKGLSSYRIVIAGERPFKELMWMEWTPKAMHTFVYSSSISSLQPQQKVELVDMDLNDGEGFEDKRLSSHLREVYSDVNTFLHCSDLDPKIEKSLPAGMSFVNIVDMVANRGAYDFFIIVARYCSRRFGFLFLSLEKDVPHLSEPPILMNASARSISLIKSRLLFLVRFAAVTYLGTEDYDSPSTLFIALHKGSLSPDSIKKHVSKLEDELKNEVHRQGLPSKILGEVLAINPDDKNDLNYLKKRIENLVMERKTAMLNLKLSWIFMQSILHSPKTLYIPLDEVKKLAEQLKMEDEEVMEFLHDFTGYCDILYIPDILPNVVILDPFVFINHLFHLFNPLATNDLHATYGFISRAEIRELIGNEATDVVVPAVCNAGLAVEINKSKVTYPESLESEAYLFIPSARSGGLCTLKEESSLYIVYQSKIMPPDMIGMFVQEFMTSKILTMNVKLYPTKERNTVTLVLKKGFILTLVFHHESVEVKLPSLSSDQAELTAMCTEVDGCCRSALSRIQMFFPKLSYTYALLCHDLNNYEYLPKPLVKFCRSCKMLFEDDSQRNAWYHTIQNIPKATEDLKTFEDAETEKHIQAFQDAVRNQRSIPMYMAQCMPFGPPRVGKTCLLNRLLNKPVLGTPATRDAPGSTPNSTIVLDKRKVIYSTVIAEGGHWKEIENLEEESAVLLNSVDLIHHESIKHVGITDSLTEHAVVAKSSTATISPTKGGNDLISQQKPDENITSHSNDLEAGHFRYGALVTSPDSGTHEMDTRYNILNELLESMKRKDMSKVEKLLEDTLTIFYTDTGGQPEFQEVLPALVAGPTIFVLIFNLAKGLGARYTVTYHTSDKETYPYKSSFTVKNVFMQCLSSIASYHNALSQDVALRDSKCRVPPLSVLVVATHKDLVKEAEVIEIDKELKEAVEPTSLFRNGCIEYSPDEKDQLVIPVDNYNEKNDSTSVRKVVENIIRRKKGGEESPYKIIFPVNWLALELWLRNMNQSTVKYEECIWIAEKCNISKKDLRACLLFLHHQTGTIRYYHRIEELKNTIIIQPSVIFEAVSELITNTFARKNFDRPEIKAFESLGLFKRGTLKSIFEKHQDKLQISCDAFLALLKYLNILGPVHDPDYDYFLPCALVHAPDPPPSEIHLDPLLVLFKGGFVPKGIFSALLAYLVRELEWRIRRCRGSPLLFRNQASFYTNSKDDNCPVTLKATDECFEVRNEAVCTMDCYNVCKHLEEGIINVCKSLRYDESFCAQKYGFYCNLPECAQDKKHCAEVDCKEMKIECPRTRKKYSVSKEREHWFKVKFIAVQATSSSDISQKQKEKLQSGVRARRKTSFEPVSSQTSQTTRKPVTTAYWKMKLLYCVLIAIAVGMISLYWIYSDDQSVWRKGAKTATELNIDDGTGGLISDNEDLLYYMSDVTEIKLFCSSLGLGSECSAIVTQYTNLDDQKYEILRKWKQLKSRTWKEFVRSLALLKKCVVAAELASEHSITFNPSDRDDKRVLTKCKDINSPVK